MPDGVFKLLELDAPEMSSPPNGLIDLRQLPQLTNLEKCIPNFIQSSIGITKNPPVWMALPKLTGMALEKIFIPLMLLIESRLNTILSLKLNFWSMVL